MPTPHRTTRSILLALLLTCLALTGAQPYSAALATGASALSPQSSVLSPASPFGVVGAMRWPEWGSFTRPADAVLETGASWIREDFVWGLIEPKEGRYEWTATDRIVGALRDRKLNVLGIISYSANWATPAREDDTAASAISFYPPDPNKYYSFVRDLVTRYKGSISHWEIWNEPDNALFWKPKPNGKEYAALLKTAYKAVKDADPSAKVLTGGVSGNAVPYLEEMMAAGAGDSFDILALHPYAVPLDPAQARIESRPEVHKMVDVELNKYRAFLQRHGKNRPIWVTELGWPARDWGLNAEDQADYLAQAYAQMLASGLAERIFWYSWKDEGPNKEQTWGLVGWGTGAKDLAPKRPAFNAYATSARMLVGAKPAGRLQIAPYTVVEDFEAPAEWTRSSHPQGVMATSTEDAYGGARSGKLQYNLTGANQAVDFAPPQPVTLPGRPTRLGLQVRGDTSGDYLSAWLRDRDGELFKVRMGAVTGAADGWRYFEARINNYYFDWERAGGNPANGTVDYPLQFVSFRLENTPDEPAGSGAIYIDNLQTSEGPDASAVRFTRPDGQVVDMLWSVDPTTVKLPTRSKGATLTERDGGTQTLEAKDGTLTLQVSSKPMYVLHTPPEGRSGQYAGPAVGLPDTSSPPPLALCLAIKKAEAISDPQASDNLYFSETGHNLRGRFRAYWEERGGVNTFGYPITEEFTAPSTDGKPYRQQYFERARMELHPDNTPPYDVQLGLLGVWLTTGRGFARSAATSEGGGILYFKESGQTLKLFKDKWSNSGGLALYGLPISPELQERNPTDGKLYTVQYFERNRLEHHPEYAGSPQEYLIGLLGVEYLKGQGCR